MGLWLNIQRWAIRQLAELTWRNLALLTLSYVIISWWLLYLAGEIELIASPSRFIYFLIVTASTVGYGDLSPSSVAGQWILALFVIPMGVSLFAMVLGRMARFFVQSWRRSITGRKRLKMKNHIIVLGWHEQRTTNMLRMLLHEEDGRRPIVLCTTADIENPMPGKIDYVHVASYTCEHTMGKAALGEASCFVVDTMQDDVSLTAALFLTCHNPNADLIAYFDDPNLARLLKLHCPHAECVPSVSVELLAKSAVDPGSSRLHQELLSTHKGMTQYATVYPKGAQTVMVSDVFMQMKQQYDAILIALDHGQGIELNPDLSAEIKPGCRIFYIADERVHDFKWSHIKPSD